MAARGRAPPGGAARRGGGGPPRARVALRRGGAPREDREQGPRLALDAPPLRLVEEPLVGGAGDRVEEVGERLPGLRGEAAEERLDEGVARHIGVQLAALHEGAERLAGVGMLLSADGDGGHRGVAEHAPRVEEVPRRVAAALDEGRHILLDAAEADRGHVLRPAALVNAAERVLPERRDRAVDADDPGEAVATRVGAAARVVGAADDAGLEHIADRRPEALRGVPRGPDRDIRRLAVVGDGAAGVGQAEPVDRLGVGGEDAIGVHRHVGRRHGREGLPPPVEDPEAEPDFPGVVLRVELREPLELGVDGLGAGRRVEQGEEAPRRGEGLGEALDQTLERERFQRDGLAPPGQRAIGEEAERAGIAQLHIAPPLVADAVDHRAGGVAERGQVGVPTGEAAELRPALGQHFGACREPRGRGGEAARREEGLGRGDALGGLGVGVHAGAQGRRGSGDGVRI